MAEPAEVLYRVGTDRVLVDETTRYGLRVLHVMRRQGVPDIDAWTASYPQADGRLYEDDKHNWHLWLFWKPQPNKQAEQARGDQRNEQ